jgi:sodium-dependent dicarboxylate transporter 2/3/5
MRDLRAIGVILGPVAFVATLASPTGLDPEAHRLAAVIAWVVIYWVTEAIPLAATALLGPALAVLLGVAGVKETFASFGHPILFVFLGSFLIAGAMASHGLDRRIALFVLSRPGVGEHPVRILVAFGTVAAFLSMWMSNTATAAMMLPIALGVLRTVRPERHSEEGSRAFGTALLLAIAYSCSLGGIATPVGTPPNLISVGLIDRITGRSIGFLEWMTFGVPLSAACLAVLFVSLVLIFRVRRFRTTGAAAEIDRERRSLGRWSRGEFVALGAFLAVVILWIAPGLTSLLLGADSPLAEALEANLPEGVAALLAAIPLFAIPIGHGRRALRWQDAMKIDWGTILLFGGGLALGGLAHDTGLAAALGGGALDAARGMPAWGWVPLAALVGSLLTEFLSNTATANLLVPLFLGFGGAAAGDGLLPALAVTIGCSAAFCFPVGTPPNAIVFGSGHIRLADMIRVGIFLDLACVFVTWGVLAAAFQG